MGIYYVGELDGSEDHNFGNVEEEKETDDYDCDRNDALPTMHGTRNMLTHTSVHAWSVSISLQREPWPHS